MEERTGLHLTKPEDSMLSRCPNLIIRPRCAPEEAEEHRRWAVPAGCELARTAGGPGARAGPGAGDIAGGDIGWGMTQEGAKAPLPPEDDVAMSDGAVLERVAG
mmetsp:Transcript_143327/g.445538  ORF Transcript_143327/g.445538 Transcript_143327/m.445538 type:complete len:104 (+) Transcript_143327:340-651(+)